MIPLADRHWLLNAHVPTTLLDFPHHFSSNRDRLCLVDLEIKNGKIAQIIESNHSKPDTESLDLHKKLILPYFVDIHTHLDKGHIWERSPNLIGTFDGAIASVQADSQRWNPEDLYRRMTFGLKCSYAHGTRAIRTHLDSFGRLGAVNFEVFKALREEWRDRITLEAVCLVSLDYFLQDEGIELADRVAEARAILGGVPYPNPALETQLDQVFELAEERNLDLDFHADETADPQSTCLQKIAETAIRREFQGQILCGHCCSLAMQEPEQVALTVDRVKQANIGIVSLPMCNLFLQDRQGDRTPHWRGVTRVHELKQGSVPVMFASDNCRDPFFGFGDHDGLEVWRESVRIAHLDPAYSDWIPSITKTAANWMNLPHLGHLAPGLPANFIIFNARYWSELLSRPQSDRLCIEQGQPLTIALPDYAELDDLVKI
jgi:cytosine deaminase